jgi:nucleoside-diphosphate-sugar epimerase
MVTGGAGFIGSRTVLALQEACPRLGLRFNPPSFQGAGRAPHLEIVSFSVFVGSFAIVVMAGELGRRWYPAKR